MTAVMSTRPEVRALKADPDTPPIIIAADRNRAKIKTAFLAAVGVAEQQDPFDRWSIEQTLAAALSGEGLPGGAYSLIEAWQQAFRDGANAAIAELEDAPILKAIKPTVGNQLKWDPLDYRTVAEVSRNTAELIADVSARSRRAIEAVLNRSGRLSEKIRNLRQYIGLTEQQAIALQNYQTNLESGNIRDLRDAASRALRDRRFDRSLQNAIEQDLALPQVQIDRMVRRYRERLIDYRARTIAETESKRAANLGQREVWRQAEQQGLLNRTRTRVRWQTGTAPCEICAPLNGNQIQLGQNFQTAVGSVPGPPVHPHCKCFTGLVFLR